MADLRHDVVPPHEAYLFRLIAEQVRDYAVFLLDAEGRVATWSRGAERLLGYGEAEVLGQPADRFFVPQDVRAGVPEQELRDALETGRGPDDRWHVRKDGTRFWCSGVITPLWEKDGRLRGFAKIMRDLTGQKLREDALADALAYADAIVQTVRQPLLVLGGDLHVQKANSAFYQTFQVCREETEGRPLYHLGSGQWDIPRLRELLEHVLRESTSFQDFAVEHDFPTLGRRVMLLNARTLCRGDGRPELILLAIEDVTERKRAEEALKEADRRKDEFLATLAHELRNPLAPMTTALHIIQRGTSALPAVQRAARTIDRQIAHMGRLVEDLLDVSRITRGKAELHREALDLEAVVEQAVETVQHHVTARRHRLHVEYSHVPYWGDPARLHQVVANLLSNAAKYTPEGGDLWVELAQEGDLAVLRVRDTGLGIAPEMLDRVFDLFVQEDRAVRHGNGGLGIGLTLVKSLVQMHGGTVRAHSEGPGRGCTFEVRLPMAEPARAGAASPAGADGASRPSPSRPRVLVIDDNQDAANSMAEFLRLEGYEAHVAYDGETGLEQIARLAPDAVLLDLGLPGIDGYEVARSLPEEGRPYLIALTGYGQPRDRRRTRQAGFNEHLVKPPRPDHLLDLLSNVTGGAKTG